MSKILDVNGEATRAKIRVAIAVPTGDQLSSGFAYSLTNMVGATAAHRRDIELRLIMERGSVLPALRHDLVMIALEMGCTHILWLDSDMRFPKDTLVRLLEHAQPIVGANYPRRRFPIDPVAMMDDGQPVFTEEGADGLLAVDYLGMGVMLTDIRVFEEIPAPWFQIGFSPKTGGYAGEDVYFCRIAREHGHTVLVDLGLSHDIAHVGEMEYRGAHALQARELASRGQP